MRTWFRHAWSKVCDTTMLFAFILWLCLLPFVLWLLVPWLGWQTALFGAGVALVLALMSCYALCAFPDIVTDRKP